MAKGGSWIQHPITGKLIPRSAYVRPSTDAPYIQGDIESFVSPIDGSVITDRAQRRMHEKQHGVTHVSDYSPDYMAKKQAEREGVFRCNTEKERQSRIHDINQAYERHNR